VTAPPELDSLTLVILRRGPKASEFSDEELDFEETRELAEQDPSVQVGRLAVEVMTWGTPKGELAFPRLSERRR
jgi:hypothetical protein